MINRFYWFSIADIGRELSTSSIIFKKIEGKLWPWECGIEKKHTTVPPWRRRSNISKKWSKVSFQMFAKIMRSKLHKNRLRIVAIKGLDVYTDSQTETHTDTLTQRQGLFRSKIFSQVKWLKMKNNCCRILIKILFPLDNDYQLLNSLKAWHICYSSSSKIDIFTWFFSLIESLIWSCGWRNSVFVCVCLFVFLCLSFVRFSVCLSVLELSSRNY